MFFKSNKERLNKPTISTLNRPVESNKTTKDLSDWTASRIRARKTQELEMNKSNTFSINFALDYTCHRSNGQNQSKSLDFCGDCNSCQILNRLNHMKQWFNRASHVVIKEFLINLIIHINNVNIYRHLDDLLRPIAQSKDYLYARNKYLPSNEQDQFKATNNRCLTDDYVNKQIESINVWYTKASSFIKLNFMLSLLNRCDQAIVFEVINKIKSILDSMPEEESALQTPTQTWHRSHSNTGNKRAKKTQFVVEDIDVEIVLDAFDEEEDKFQNEEDKFATNELNKIFYEAPNSKHVDFIRQLPVHLSKLILKSLNKKSLHNCLFVSKYWYNLIREVHKETVLNKGLISDILLLRVGINISYSFRILF
jgi:F-box/WD-40 domain protein 10